MKLTKTLPSWRVKMEAHIDHQWFKYTKVNMKNTVAVLGARGFVGGVVADVVEACGTPPLRIGRHSPNPSAPIDELWCCAAPGSMVHANSHPQEDAAAVEAVFDRMETLAPRRVVLVSTIAALEAFGAGQDEDSTQPEKTTPYGANRAWLEERVQTTWGANALVLRLPALFGPGLKKNALYDLLHPLPSFLRAPDAQRALDLLGPDWAQMGAWSADGTQWTLNREQAEHHTQAPTWAERLHGANLTSWRFSNPESTYQFYEVPRLVDDAHRLIEAGIRCAHLAPEPLRLRDVAQAYGVDLPTNGAKLHHESLRTRHSSVFGSAEPYIQGRGEVLDNVRSFLRSEV